MLMVRAKHMVIDRLTLALLFFWTAGSARLERRLPIKRTPQGRQGRDISMARLSSFRP